jgi:hypothetical protein
MTRIPERKFDPALPVFARKFFIANGHRYEPGMRFPWASTGVSQRRAMQMFEAGKLTHDDKMAVEPAPEPVEVIVEDKLDELAEMGQEWDAEPVSEPDDLDAIDDMKELRAIADSIGAPYKVSKADQRQAIRDHRNKETD